MKKSGLLLVLFVLGQTQVVRAQFFEQFLGTIFGIFCSFFGLFCAEDTSSSPPTPSPESAIPSAAPSSFLAGDNGNEDSTFAPEIGPNATCADDNGDTTFIVSSFTAKYYDDSILVHQETVARPSINYAWDEFYGITSRNFSAVWTGTLMAVIDSIIQVDLVLSWSTAVLLVDGVKQLEHTNYDKTVAIPFAAGSHSLEVQYINNWHTVEFIAAFHQTCYKTVAEAGAQVVTLLQDSTVIVHIDTYESGDTYLDISVIIDTQPPSILLLLTSYSTVNWIIGNPNAVPILGVVQGSYEPATTVTVDDSIVIAVDESDFNYEPPIALVQQAAGGRSPDHTYSEYALASLRIAF